MSHDELLATLEDADASGVFHLPLRDAEAIRRAAASAGLACFDVSLEDCSSLDEVLGRLGHDLDFPDWYGHNLDALKDCLTDFSWAEAAGYVLIIVHAEGLLAHDPAALAVLTEVFVEAIAEWRSQGYPMWIFLDVPAAGLAIFATTA
ncbi:MAG TPA: barstar family protein [Candidatus Accumulibacter phosphatis]|nr:MAG: Barstar (barnase inhibitor) [Candidatus Accumulibacter sp. SK-11]HCN67705.1 hypothetical protein [Accumulibacter sp.]HCV13904.1 hypothetical protein [Accumulibacter sp.]HRL77123.1 barstar family protein [Candidatus Accumulibacter phosphatis]HRQ95464.1 barstar family protein [Candidatus Accumulibacter phosphatis]